MQRLKWWRLKWLLSVAVWGARVALIVLVITLAGDPARRQITQLVLAGDLAVSEQRYGAAITTFTQALALQPADGVILLRLFNAARAARRYELASIYLDQLVAQQGWTAVRYEQAAQLASDRADWVAAIAFWQASLRGTVADRATIRRVIDEALVQRDWPRAQQQLEAWLALDPRDEWALYRVGLLRATREPRLAQTYLSSAAADPQYRDLSNAILNLYADHSDDPPETLALRIGLALMRAKEWGFAELALSEAAQTGNPIAWAFLGLARDQQGRDGFPLILQALASAPDDPQVNYAAAVHYRLTGAYDEALALLNTLGNNNPTNAAIAAEIGSVQQAQGRFVEALSWLKTAVALAPDDPQFAALLANLYVDEAFSLGGEGTRVIGALAKKFPTSPDILTSYGWALYRSGDIVGARAQLEQALRLDLTGGRTRYYYALLQEARGDRASAIDSLLYVYQYATDLRFRDLAVRALDRLGYKPSLSDLTGR